MPDYEKLLQVAFPPMMDSALEALNHAFSTDSQLSAADFSDLDQAEACIIIYSSRDEVIFANQKARGLLAESASSLAAAVPAPVPWLEENSSGASEDFEVLLRGSLVSHCQELVGVAAGKTWLEGRKRPILSSLGIPMAIAFIGNELKGSQQIRKAAQHRSQTSPEYANN